MYKTAFSLLLNLILLTTLASSAQAEILRLTFQGTGALIDDPDNILPFAPPSSNAVFTLTATVDTANLVTMPLSPPYSGENSNTILESAFLAFDNQRYDAPSDSSWGAGLFSIGNDLPLDPYYPGSPLVTDHFGISLINPFATDPTGPLFQVSASFVSEFDPSISSGPINSADFFVPDPNDWDLAIISVVALDPTLPISGWPTTLASMNVAIDLVSVEPVPIPAAAWLFGSALISLVGLGRRHRQ